jgi:amidase
MKSSQETPATPSTSRAQTSALETKLDPSFGTAAQAIAALRQRVISSRELTAHVFDRIKTHNPKLNLFVTLSEDRAMTRAAEADEMLARKEPLGPLHGLPVVAKDVFASAGVRTTSGSKMLEKYVPNEDAVAVARFNAAGAILVGKTNVPEFAGDWQAFNEVAGTSNNPWDLARTPGGSTGGGAASLAVGFGFLEVGGDLAGSIRIPSHFCGVYGHKSTLDLVPSRGHIPPPPGITRGPAELPVAGPLARSAEDLRLALEVLGGPDSDESIAYRWTLPKPRKTKLSDYRIGYVIDDPFCPVDSPVKECLGAAIEALRKHGVRLVEGWPPQVNPLQHFETFSWLLAAFLSQTVPDASFEGLQRAAASGANDPWTSGTTALHREWLRQSAERFTARAVWQDYFTSHDAFFMPASFVAAFPHDHRDMRSRTLSTTQGARPYSDLARWASFATLTGCPATVAPIGLTSTGLPVGIQIMGPFLEDATTIDIAGKMADLIGGFVAPPDFAR